MENKLICTLRPFECKYCREDNRCGAHDDDEQICQYAKQATETTAYLNDNASTFVYDPTIRIAVQEEGRRIIKVLQYTLSQIYDEEQEQVTEVVDMNTNHEFPPHIVEVLESLKFAKKELRYYGVGQNYIKDSVLEFGIDGESLMCRDVTNMKNLFIVKSTIGLGYFIVLLQAYGIMHGRYIYECVDGISEEFSERLDNQ